MNGAKLLPRNVTYEPHSADLKTLL